MEYRSAIKSSLFCVCSVWMIKRNDKASELMTPPPPTPTPTLTDHCIKVCSQNYVIKGEITTKWRTPWKCVCCVTQLVPSFEIVLFLYLAVVYIWLASRSRLFQFVRCWKLFYFVCKYMTGSACWGEGWILGRGMGVACGDMLKIVQNNHEFIASFIFFGQYLFQCAWSKKERVLLVNILVIPFEFMYSYCKKFLFLFCYYMGKIYLSID